MVDVEDFIKVIRDHEALWRIAHPDYRNRKAKAELWCKISKELHVTVIDCKKKWKALRDSFSRENAKVAKDADVPMERWQYYYQLNFLKGNIRRKEREGSKYWNADSNLSAGNLKATRPGEFVLIADAIKSEFHLSESNLPESLNEDPLWNEQPLSPATEAVSQMETASSIRGTQRHKSPASRHSRGYSPTTSSPEASLAVAAKRSRTDIDDNLLRTLQNLNELVQLPASYTHEDHDDEDTLFSKCLVKKLQKFPLRQKNNIKMKLLQMLNAEEEHFYDQ